MANWLLAVNPTAGRGKGATLGRKVAGFLLTHNQSYRLVTANSASQMRSNLEKELDSDQEIKGIISVGGDGLLHLILQVAVPRNIPIAPIPAGTGNDLVRSLGWSTDEIDEYLNHVVTHQPRPIDLGLVDGEWFANILSTGFDSIVNERANRISWPSGPARYNVAIALELPLFKPRQYSMTLDSNVLEREAMLIAIANGPAYGGGMRVAPNADFHDGLFDVVILKPVSKFEFIKVFPLVYSGAHLSHPAIEVHRSSRVELHSDAIAYADGERVGQLPVRAECVTEAGMIWKN